MRVAKKEDEFKPIVITLETQEELSILRQLLYMKLDLSGYISLYKDQESFLAKRGMMYEALVKGAK
jgi:hypothetical protein